jgi:hypothetical protein
MNNLRNSIAKGHELLKERISDAQISFRSVSEMLKSFKVIYDLILAVVFTVEEVYYEYKLCTEDERIEVAAEILDDLILFKGWLAFLEPIDKWAFKLLLSAGVQALNDRYGKGSWPKITTFDNLKSTFQ